MNSRFLVLAALAGAAVPALAAQTSQAVTKTRSVRRPIVQNSAFRNIAPKLTTTAVALNRDYRLALKENPRLTRDQFLTACVLSHNLVGDHPSVSRNSVLRDLKRGRTFQSALTGLGLTSTEAHTAVRQAAREVRAADAKPMPKKTS